MEDVKNEDPQKAVANGGARDLRGYPAISTLALCSLLSLTHFPNSAPRSFPDISSARARNSAGVAMRQR